MKKRAIAVLVIILTLLVSACSSDNTATDTNNNSTGGTKEFNKEELNIAMPAAPPNLDPHLSVAAVTGQVVLNMFETLVTFDENYEVQPSLAEKIEISEDGKTYTFPLWDITFHDGEKLTAADVIASLERWGRLSPVGRNAMADVELEEQDEQTVVMKLKQASNTILYDLAYPTSQAAYILPKKIIDKFGDDVITEFIGTGPYKFDEWKADQYIQLSENTEYNNPSFESSGLAGAKELSYKQLRFYIVTDASTRLNGIKSGEYDLALSLTTDQYDSLQGNQDLETTIVKPASYPGLIFDNTTGIFSEVDARQAVLAALDFDEIMLASAGHKDFYRVSPGLLMEEQTTWFTDKDGGLYNRKDQEEAKELLKKAGYNGEPITIMATQDYDYMYNAALVIQSQLAEIGMNVNLEIYDWPTLLAKRAERNEWDAFVSGFPMVAQPTQTLFLDSKNGHASGYASEEMDNFLNKIRTAPTQEEAYTAWEEAQELYWKDVPVIKLGDNFQFNASQKGVKTSTIFSLNVFWE